MEPIDEGQEAPPDVLERDISLEPVESLYLGDGVYVGLIGDQVVLTTGHHQPHKADNTVFLEPSVLTALQSYIKRKELHHGSS